MSQNISKMGLCLFITVVKLLSQLMGDLSSSFSVKVAVDQVSALSSLLFIMVMDVLMEDMRDGSLMELWFIDGIVVCKRSCFVWEIVK